MSAQTSYTKCPFCDQILNELGFTAHVRRRHALAQYATKVNSRHHV